MQLACFGAQCKALPSSTINTASYDTSSGEYSSAMNDITLASNIDRNRLLKVLAAACVASCFCKFKRSTVWGTSRLPYESY